MKKLLIDTATEALILILAEDEKIIDAKCEKIVKDHSSKLLPALDEMLKKNGRIPEEIDAFYVTAGPGSYTGLRIGITVSKMLGYMLKKPLFSVSTLEVIAASYAGEGELLLPVIDARRGNVFGALYKVKDGKLQTVIEGGLYPFVQLAQKARTQKGNVIVCGIDSAKFVFEDEHLSFRSNLEADFKPAEIMKLDFEEVRDIYAFVPEYKRLPEAEMNLNE